MLLDIFTFESMITCQVSNKVTEQRSSNYGVQKTKRKTASCKIYFFLIIKRNVMYLCTIKLHHANQCTIKLHHANQSCHSKCPYPFISVLQGIEWQIDRDAMTEWQRNRSWLYTGGCISPSSPSTAPHGLDCSTSTHIIRFPWPFIDVHLWTQKKMSNALWQRHQ